MKRKKNKNLGGVYAPPQGEKFCIEMTNYNLILVENITRKRKEKNLSQVALSEKLGINRSTYSTYEEYRARVPSSLLPMLAKAFDCDINSLFV